MRAMFAVLCLGLWPPLTAQMLAIPCNPAGSQAELNACAVEGFQKADKKMKQAYETVMGALPPAKREVLRAEQDAWVANRGHACTQQVKDYEGGTMWRQMYLDCRALETSARAAEISRWSKRK